MMWTVRSCDYCNSSFNSILKFEKHLLDKHDIDLQSYSIKTYYDNVKPTCQCGCNNSTTFNKTTLRFNSYIHGHNKISLSLEAKKSIGNKNSTHMKLYYKQYPTTANERAAKMRAALTEEIIKKRSSSVRAALKKEECKSKISKSVKKFWYDNPDIKEKRAASCKITWQYRDAQGLYEELKQHLSKTMSLKLINNEKIWQQGIFISKHNQICRYKSSYELLAMKELDSLESIVDWSYESIAIEYKTQDGKIKHYIPDFIIHTKNSNSYILEVKPKKLHAKNLMKFNAAIDYCKINKMKFVTWEPCDGSIQLVLE